MKVLNAAQMRETDRLTTERYEISSLQLMENAGLQIAAQETGPLRLTRPRVT